MQFRKKPLVVEASQWFKNGDHPRDYEGNRAGIEGGLVREFSAEHRRTLEWEGDVVRRFRRPDVDGNAQCGGCAASWNEHGWIERAHTPGGHCICPGDFIITELADPDKFYPCKAVIFAATYEEVATADDPALVVALMDYERAIDDDASGEVEDEGVALDAARNRLLDRLRPYRNAAEAAPQDLTDAEIVEVRDKFLPSQGEPFDCIAFGRAILAAAQA